MDKANIKDAKSNDASSAESAAAREFLKTVAPESTKMAGFDNLTEAQAYKVAGPLFDKYKTDRAESLADKRLGMQIKSDEKKSLKATDNEAKKYTSQLSKSYWDDDTTKDTREVAQAASKGAALAADKTGKSDVALVFAFAKSIDPRSTVREQEYKVMSSNSSLVGQVDSYMQRAKDGKLTDKERAEILSTINTSARAQNDRQAAVDKRYREQASYYGVDPKYIFNEETVASPKPSIGVQTRNAAPTKGLGGAPVAPKNAPHGKDLP
jgi:hypothetical protein